MSGMDYNCNNMTLTEAIAARHSVRAYRRQPLADEAAKALEELIAEINREGEKIACYIAVGYGASQGAGHKTKTVEQVSNAGPDTPAWFRRGVEAALLAPTAVNQQKFRFEYSGVKAGRHQVLAKRGFSMIGYTRMDLGIAKCHFEIGAGEEPFDWV